MWISWYPPSSLEKPNTCASACKNKHGGSGGKTKKKCQCEYFTNPRYQNMLYGLTIVSVLGETSVLCVYCFNKLNRKRVHNGRWEGAEMEQGGGGWLCIIQQTKRPWDEMIPWLWETETIGKYRVDENRSSLMGTYAHFPARSYSKKLKPKCLRSIHQNSADWWKKKRSRSKKTKKSCEWKDKRALEPGHGQPKTSERMRKKKEIVWALYAHLK